MSECPYIFEASEQNFDTLVLQNSHQVPILVDFWADWCAPCQMLMPVLSKLAEEYNGGFLLAKVNSDEQQALAARYGVRSLPTLKLFQNGEAVEEIMGAQPEPVLRDLLDKYVAKASDHAVAQAMMLHQKGQTEEALSLLTQTAQEDRHNHRIYLAIAAIFMEMGETEKAEEVLGHIGPEKQDDPEVKALRSQIQLAGSAADMPSLEALNQRLADNPKDGEALYQSAIQYQRLGDHAAALEQLLRLLQCDRKYGDDIARKTMLDIFEALGNQGPLVSQYRRRMMTVLY